MISNVFILFMFISVAAWICTFVGWMINWGNATVPNSQIAYIITAIGSLFTALLIAVENTGVC